MKQFTVRIRTNGGATGQEKVRAANKIAWAQRAAAKRASLKAQNAYRAAAGLPPLT